MSFLGPTEEQQVEQVADGLNVSSGDIVRRMITAAFGGSKQDQEFLDTLRRFHHADEAERSHLAPVLRGLVVHAPQMPALDAIRVPADDLPGSQQTTQTGKQQQRQTEEAKPFYETATPEEWSKAFLEWTQSHANLPSLPEQAYDRAYFYEDCR